MKTQGNSASYLPTLDGWRAIAVLLVLCRHDAVVSIGRFSDAFLLKHGELGVDIFFSISGFLICSRLLREEDRLHGISLRRFYIRRAFRILPAAMLYLGTIGILGIAHLLPVSLPEWLAATFFYRNYNGLMGHHAGPAYFTIHFWSLAVEEHFYLILPLLLVLSRRRWRLPALVIATALIEVHRAILCVHRSILEVAHHTDARLDALFIPAIVAVLIHRSPAFRARAQSILRIWPILLLLSPFVIARIDFTETGAIVFPFYFTAMVVGAVLNSTNPFGWLLETAPLRFIGRISYSIYLWQMIFFVSPLTFDGLPFYRRLPWQLVCTLACALASYHLVEQPMIHLGSRFSPSVVPGREVETVPANPVPAI